MSPHREPLLRKLADLGLDVDGIDDETPIFSEGLLDSFHLLEVMLLIEGGIGRRMKAGEVHLDNLDSVSRILTFIEGRAGSR